MEVISEKKINITPHKSIYRKMGRSSHDFNESIAELVDNSIDARTNEQKDGNEKLNIKIIIDTNDNRVIVSDNAKGMGEAESAKAIVLAESSKGKEDLGEYGFGLKTAALSIGRTFHVSTGQRDKTIGYYLKYDEDEWESDPNLDWNAFPFKEVKKPSCEHGTNIMIENLKVKLSPNRITSLKNDLGKRYRAYINKGFIVIQVNAKVCSPERINWSEGYPKTFEFDTKFGKIHGVIGLMKESSQKGLYGFDLFRKGRMIRTYNRFAIREHSTHAKIMGEIHLDFVPVTHEKNRFIEESEEYEIAEKICRESELFKRIQRDSEKRSSGDRVTEQVKERTNLWEDHIARALREPDLKSIIDPNVKTKSTTPEVPESGDGERNEDGGSTKIEVEKRNPDEQPNEQKHKEPESRRERRPKETHEAIRHTVTILGKTFKFKHVFIHDLGSGRKNYDIDEKEGIVISTNTAFPAFLATNDHPFYAAMNISEAIAEVYVKQAGLGVDKMNEIKDLVLKRASEFKNQLKDESEGKKHATKRTSCELCGAKIDFKSPLVRFCANCSKNKAREIQKRYFSSPEGKAKIREYNRKYQNDPKFKENMKKKKKEIIDEMFAGYIKEIGAG